MVIFNDTEVLTQEEIRLKQDKARTHYWKKWGPYISERQWGTGSFRSIFGFMNDIDPLVISS